MVQIVDKNIRLLRSAISDEELENIIKQFRTKPHCTYGYKLD